jgi:Cu(I)/Ag(I) efflux system membrane protein CusA/SilA
MWTTGDGSDVMKYIAAPMVGGIFASFVLEPLVYPAIYEVWRWGSYLKDVRTTTGLGSLELPPDVGSARSPWAWKSSIPTQETPTSQ